jgi:iduronate 2-sulfatase
LWSQKPEHDLLTDPLRREARQAYYASITFMDAQVGVVLDALDGFDLWDTTIVVMTSDHGYLLGEHGLWQKQSVFEPSARVPMIIAAPGMKTKGVVSERLVELIDLYPTLASLCGLDAPDYLTGIDLSPVLDDPDVPTKDYAMTQVYRRKTVDGERHEFHAYSIRSGRWRYSDWGEDWGEELYDHELDPRELYNLAKNPVYQIPLETMRELLKQSKQRAKPLPPITRVHLDTNELN